jgi:cell division protein FtsB
MFDFYQKRKLKTFFASPLTRGFLLLLVFLMSWSALTRYQIAQEMSDRRLEAEVEVERLKEQKTGLEDQVQYLSDDRGIEAEMRRQFDVALTNEQVVVIVEPESDIETNTGTSKSSLSQSGMSFGARFVILLAH